MRRIIFCLFVFLVGANAHAGFIEIGASANYKFSGFDENNSVTSIAYTGSYAYYFMEQCALEFSYTYAYNKQLSQASPTDTRYLTEDNIDLASLDLVLSMGTKESFLQPYIKFGGGYLVKERFSKMDNGPKLLNSHTEGFVPSGGLGMKILITNSFSIKIGLDAWTSPLQEEPLIVDYVGRAGVSWMF